MHWHILLLPICACCQVRLRSGNRFTLSVCALGHNHPIIASTQRSLERLLLSETCRIVSFCTSAEGDIGSTDNDGGNTPHSGRCDD